MLSNTLDPTGQYLCNVCYTIYSIQYYVKYIYIYHTPNTSIMYVIKCISVGTKKKKKCLNIELTSSHKT